MFWAVVVRCLVVPRRLALLVVAAAQSVLCCAVRPSLWWRGGGRAFLVSLPEHGTQFPTVWSWVRSVSWPGKKSVTVPLREGVLY